LVTDRPTEPIPGEDLSKGTELSPADKAKTETANQIIEDDAKARRWHRHIAAGTALLTVLSYVGVMGYFFHALTFVLVKDNAGKISTHVVAIATVLILSLTILVVAFIKAAFVHPDDGKKSESKEKDSLVVFPGIEGVKALAEAVASLAKAVGKGGS